MFNKHKKLVMIQESSFCNHSLRVWMRYRVTLTKAFEWSLYVNVLLFCDAWWMQHSVPEICWLDPSTFRRASMSYTHLIPAGEHYYCLSACVRNSPVTLLRKSRVNEAAGSNCVSAAVEQMILLNERVNHLISCLHHKGEIAVCFSGLNGF